ncbi:MAG TPA: FMN-binding protein [Spirochaetia bacterium]|nr:FMN-binding protein [Spirochaetia bacterium]
MKKRLNAAHVGLALAALLAAISLQSCASGKIDVKTPSFASLPDGTYRGSYDGGLVNATVDVTVASGRIEKVTIVSHRCGRGKPAEAIVDDVVKNQSLDVDVVSGATRSSKVILKAIEVALTP